MKTYFGHLSLVVGAITGCFMLAAWVAIPYLIHNACYQFDARAVAVVIGGFKMMALVFCGIGSVLAAVSLKWKYGSKPIAWLGLGLNIAVFLVFFQFLRISLA